MTWMATSPYGPQLNASWLCSDCGAHNEVPLGADADVIRAAAVSHVEATGHRVSVARGTVEVLYPMATAPQGSGGHA